VKLDAGVLGQNAGVNSRDAASAGESDLVRHSVSLLPNFPVVRKTTGDNRLVHT
jgi:hypothetical protein